MPKTSPKIISDPPNVNALEKKIALLEKQRAQLLDVERVLKRKNEYLTALHETSLGLIDRPSGLVGGTDGLESVP